MTDQPERTFQGPGSRTLTALRKFDERRDTDRRRRQRRHATTLTQRRPARRRV